MDFKLTVLLRKNHRSLIEIKFPVLVMQHNFFLCCARTLHPHWLNTRHRTSFFLMKWKQKKRTKTQIFVCYAVAFRCFIFHFGFVTVEIEIDWHRALKRKLSTETHKSEHERERERKEERERIENYHLLTEHSSKNVKGMNEWTRKEFMKWIGSIWII